MSITHFPHGVLATPNIGGSRLVDIWNSENIFFVDGDNGSAGSAGKDPSDANTLISTVVNSGACIRGASIYIKPRMTVASAQTYYVDNITLPVTKPNISLLGAGADADNPYLGVDIKASTVTSAVVTVNGAGDLIEGMRLAGTGQTDNVVSILDISNNGTTTRAYGATVRGCRFANSKGHLINTGAAIAIDTAIFTKIENCKFSDNLASITARSVYAAIQGLSITDCDFGGMVLTGRDVDVFIVGDGEQVKIQRCNFNDGLPNHGIVSRFISIQTAYGLMADCNFAVSGANCTGYFGADGTKGVIPATILMCNNWMESSTAAIGMITRT
jgi:uncharacterized protein YjbI with pentapeptide repeats